MLASTIQFTTNPPTPTHNPQQQIRSPDGSGNQGALPQNPDSMPPPHTRGHPPPPNQAAAGVSPTPITRQTNPTRENKPTRHGQSPGLPQGQTPQPAQTHSTIQTTHGQEATPHNQSLERR